MAQNRNARNMRNEDWSRGADNYGRRARSQQYQEYEDMDIDEDFDQERGGRGMQNRYRGHDDYDEYGGLEENDDDYDMMDSWDHHQDDYDAGSDRNMFRSSEQQRSMPGRRSYEQDPGGMRDDYRNERSPNQRYGSYDSNRGYSRNDMRGSYNDDRYSRSRGSEYGRGSSEFRGYGDVRRYEDDGLSRRGESPRSRNRGMMDNRNSPGNSNRPRGMQNRGSSRSRGY
jgi:hypothetical protein